VSKRRAVLVISSFMDKLILCAVMLRGRHRGLPVAIDRAVLLPREGLARAEEEDAAIRLERTKSIKRALTTGFNDVKSDV
jgi:Cation transport protein